MNRTLTLRRGHTVQGKSMQIRDAVQSDIPQITAIYNQVLTTSTAIYNDQPATLEDRLDWWRTRIERQYPVLVAADRERVCGFGSFGDFRTWPGYRYTVEGTVHVSSDSRGQGVGSLLLKAIIMHARLAGKHSMIAGVDSGNTASLHFLERSGFQRVGYLPEVGYKFDRFLNLVLLQYFITPRVENN
jgi:L-amino acid N-acyltransferase YncA